LLLDEPVLDAPMHCAGTNYDVTTCSSFFCSRPAVREAVLPFQRRHSRFNPFSVNVCTDTRAGNNCNEYETGVPGGNGPPAPFPDIAAPFAHRAPHVGLVPPVWTYGATSQEGSSAGSTT
jgi:hypothetical protein